MELLRHLLGALDRSRMSTDTESSPAAPASATGHVESSAGLQVNSSPPSNAQFSAEQLSNGWGHSLKERVSTFELVQACYQSLDIKRRLAEVEAAIIEHSARGPDAIFDAVVKIGHQVSRSHTRWPLVADGTTGEWLAKDYEACAKKQADSRAEEFLFKDIEHLWSRVGTLEPVQDRLDKKPREAGDEKAPMVAVANLSNNPMVELADAGRAGEATPLETDTMEQQAKKLRVLRSRNNLAEIFARSLNGWEYANFELNFAIMSNVMSALVEGELEDLYVD